MTYLDVSKSLQSKYLKKNCETNFYTLTYISFQTSLKLLTVVIKIKKSSNHILTLYNGKLFFYMKTTYSYENINRRCTFIVQKIKQKLQINRHSNKSGIK